MHYIFLVQGEGRGHMTQALSMFQILSTGGHKVDAVLIGTNKARKLPLFVIEKIKAPIYYYESPNFKRDKENKGIKIVRSFLVNLYKAGTYFRSLRQINKIIKEYHPDAIINFYDLMGGLLYFLYNPAARHIAIAHQFIAMHPKFTFPAKHYGGKLMLKLLNRITAYRADKILALSYNKMADTIKERLYVVPPLMRREILDTKPEIKAHILVYILNNGYANDILEASKTVQDQEVHVFCDGDCRMQNTEMRKFVIFHPLDEIEYLNLLRSCTTFISTAGFESICEALYLSKPVMVVPVKNHYEQLCNAIDAQKTGGVLYLKSYDFEVALEFSNKCTIDYNKFKKWVLSGEQIFTDLLTFQ